MSCSCNSSYYNLPCCCPPAKTGTTTTSTTTLCPDAIPCEEAYQSDCIIYNGPDLTCYGIQTGYSVTQILNIIIAQLDPCTTTTTTTTTICLRPVGLTTYTFNTAINGVPFNGTLTEACDAFNQYINDPTSTLTGIVGEAASLGYGETMYFNIGTDCSKMPNGYYIVQGLPGVLVITNGIVTSLELCPPTTTTSTSTTTTTTVNPFAPFLCECINYSIENLSGFNAVIPFTDCLTGLPDPNGIIVLAGGVAEFCACLDSIPTITGITVTPIGPCPIPTTTTTTVEPTTSTTTIEPTTSTTTTIEPTTSTTTTVEPTTSTTTTVEPTTSTTTTIEPTTSTTTVEPTTSTTTTADPAITTTTSTTSTTTTSTTTTTTINPAFSRFTLRNNDLTYGSQILGLEDLASGNSLDPDSGGWPILAGEERVITLANGLWDLIVYINLYSSLTSVTLVDANGTPDCRNPAAEFGSITYTGVYIDDFGGVSSSGVTLVDAVC